MAAVEAKGELVEIRLEMVRLDGALLGPQEPCTDTAQCVAMAECLADDVGQKACRCAEGYFSLDGACHLLKLPDDKCSGGGNSRAYLDLLNCLMVFPCTWADSCLRSICRLGSGDCVFVQLFADICTCTCLSIRKFVSAPFANPCPCSIHRLVSLLNCLR